jgi:hypothetical protein
MIENSRESGGPIESPEEDWTQAEQDLRIEPKPHSYHYPRFSRA